MNEIANEQFFLVEKLAQEEAKHCRRSKVKNLAKSIRDWWNHLGELTPAEREVDERRNEIRTRCEYFRIQL